MKVREIMISPIVKISAGASVSEAAKLMDMKNVGCLPVDENREMVGMVTERDIIRKIVAKGLNSTRIRVEDIMTSPIFTIGAESGIEEANELMVRKQIRRLPVESEGEIVGIITLRDVSKYLKHV